MSGAGSTECNGFYARDGEYGGCPLFKNGRWWLLRYTMKSGISCWYIADKDTLDKNVGDMYRVESGERLPPTDVEWLKAKDGVLPAPWLLQPRQREPAALQGEETIEARKTADAIEERNESDAIEARKK